MCYHRHASFSFSLQPGHYRVKNPAGTVSGVLAAEATVSFDEMIEHSFYQVNTLRVVYLAVATGSYGAHLRNMPQLQPLNTACVFSSSHPDLVNALNAGSKPGAGALSPRRGSPSVAFAATGRSLWSVVRDHRPGLRPGLGQRRLSRLRSFVRSLIACARVGRHRRGSAALQRHLDRPQRLGGVRRACRARGVGDGVGVPNQRGGQRLRPAPSPRAGHRAVARAGPVPGALLQRQLRPQAQRRRRRRQW